LYIKRDIESSIRKLSSFFPVLLVTGPRQVGKTTVLKNCAEPGRSFVSLDTLEIRELAQNDPALFLQRYKTPLIIDEIQYAPQLFSYIKAAADTDNIPGMFWLTGSQQFLLMKDVTESLAGRAGILNLQGFSYDEKFQKKSFPFIPDRTFISRKENDCIGDGINAVYKQIWKGSYPRLYTAADEFWEAFYSSYVQTYIERDVRSLTKIGSETDFLKFMKASAARIGNLLDYADMAKDIGVSQPTVKAWISILNASGIVYLLQPYSTNLTNRIVKTPKLYFMDTGLAAYLCGWKTPEVLETGAMNGAFFEDFVITEILKSFIHNGKAASLYFYRDKEKKEIDLLIDENGMLYPVEIKKTAAPSKADISDFSVLDKLRISRGPGAVICMAQTHLPLTVSDTVIPVGYM